ncbi:glycoside hydrolase [Lipomyces oligophaga]|uniref:glycoside hydrolase n=1 Tax=Lipomyces oligophaga TaxID=45792 RepID=UPI0034CFF317
MRAFRFGAFAVLLLSCSVVLAFPRKQLDELREETREAFYHGWNSYLQYGFPEDEVTPLSCSGRGRDRANPNNNGLNDVLGDFSLTLVDSMDTLVIMGDRDGFEAAVRKVERFVHFDLPSRVQVFETTIRILGGLLSAHIYASSPDLGYQIPGYKNSLLDLAIDLADRLLPAFDTPTGIPLARVNLRDGVANETITETCTAGAGSLVLEFATLSRLVGDDRYEAAARRAFFAVWERRTSLDLVGSTIDAVSGLWTTAYSGIGASVDSFFEYAFKAYILLGDDNFLEVFQKSYAAIKLYSLEDGWLYKNVHIVTGNSVTSWIDALAAFFPGLQSLAGDINAAIRHHLVYYKIWMAYAGIPERWNFQRNKGSVELGWYGLRPEFVESNYFLYQATKDPFYLHVGAQILADLQARARSPCGFAVIHDVLTGDLDDRMESFFLTETLKYLYLLFDVDNPLNKDDSNFVFSTEGHPLRITSNLALFARNTSRLPDRIIRRQAHDEENIDLDRRVLDFGVKTEDEVAFQGHKQKDDNMNDEVVHLDDNLKRLGYTCPNVNSQGFFFSFVVSWSEFYHLDGIFNFEAIQDSVFPKRERTNYSSQSQLFASNMQNSNLLRAIIDLPASDPRAISVPLSRSQSGTLWELFIPASKPSILKVRGLDIEANSLDGHRVRFIKVDEEQDDGSWFFTARRKSASTTGVRLLNIGGVKVMGTVKLQTLMSTGYQEQEVFEILRDGRVRFQGEEILNLVVGI